MKNFKIEIKWAFIFIAMMLLWMLMEKLTGLHDVNIELHPIVTNFIAVPAILIYVLALRDKRKNFYNCEMSYKQGFISGLVITIIITIFSPLIQYITSAFITPDYFANVISYSVKEGLLTQEEAESNFNLNSYMIQSLIGSFVMGILTTAVVAFFIKSKKKPE